MPRPKRSSKVLDKAQRRIAGIRSISATLDFGEGLSLLAYDAIIQDLQTLLSSYNTMLSAIDEVAGKIALKEQAVSSFSEKMLMSVGTRYGKDSLQYGMAGGTIRNGRTRSRNATPDTTPPVASPTVAASASAASASTAPDPSTATPNGNGSTVVLN